MAVLPISPRKQLAELGAGSDLTAGGGQVCPQQSSGLRACSGDSQRLGTCDLSKTSSSRSLERSGQIAQDQGFHCLPRKGEREAVLGIHFPVSGVVRTATPVAISGLSTCLQ